MKSSSNDNPTPQQASQENHTRQYSGIGVAPSSTQYEFQPPAHSARMDHLQSHSAAQVGETNPQIVHSPSSLAPDALGDYLGDLSARYAASELHNQQQQQQLRESLPQSARPIASRHPSTQSPTSNASSFGVPNRISRSLSEESLINPGRSVSPDQLSMEAIVQQHQQQQILDERHRQQSIELQNQQATENAFLQSQHEKQNERLYVQQQEQQLWLKISQQKVLEDMQDHNMALMSADSQTSSSVPSFNRFNYRKRVSPLPPISPIEVKSSHSSPSLSLPTSTTDSFETDQKFNLAIDTLSFVDNAKRDREPSPTPVLNPTNPSSFHARYRTLLNKSKALVDELCDFVYVISSKGFLVYVSPGSRDVVGKYLFSSFP
ncbi:hypothetical protein BKA69DRAFT_466982 [Paraphysoderma sedebokerense]|nr:hypothetical protein BKA69DRAFT_466982 [Paraphysoderma sedebokerense]